MLKTYEAIYENGQLKWLAEQPDLDSARVLITVVEELAQDLPSDGLTKAQRAARALAKLGGTEPDLEDIPRRQWDGVHENAS
jgi:hypothetical protein